MNWERHKDTWPNAAHSRFVDLGNHNWHIQDAGSGPTILLLHGAGGATHSWRKMFAELAQTHRVIALDLPGQGFTQRDDKSRSGLDAMSNDITALLQHEAIAPDVIIGHSAGAAIMFRIALDWPEVKNTKLVSINGALGNFRGLAGLLFPVMAKLLALNPLTASIFASTAAKPERVRSILKSTGSQIDAEGEAQYLSLMSDRGHVDATLAMMAQWKLDRLLTELPKLTQDCLFITGAKDQAVPPDTSSKIAARLPSAVQHEIPVFGHLVHEEAPGEVLAALHDFLDTAC